METKDLLDELGKMKTAIEGTLAEKAKTEIAEQLAESLKAVTAQIEAVKAASDNTEVLKALEAQVAESKSNYDAMLKAFNMLQVRVKGVKAVDEKAPSLQDALKKSLEDATDDIAKFERKETKHIILDLKSVGDVSTANVTGGTAWSTILMPGIIQTPARKVHIRSLIPGGTTGQGTVVDFMRENGAGEGAIAPTAEGATKPQIDIDLIESSVKIETIAGWLRLSRKVMANVPGLISFLQARLPEKLLRVEDDQLLNGDGASPNIKGIAVSGNYTAAADTGVTLVERLMDAIAQLEQLDRSATGILVTPAVKMSLFKNVASGSGEYDLPMNVSVLNGNLFIAGVPVFASTAAGASQYIVGDWAMGAQFLTQEGMRVEFFEQDGTNVRENKITVRIEESVALPVFGSDYFIVGVVPA